MLDKEAYLDKLLKELEVLKKRGRRSLYKINEEISEELVNGVREYFSNNSLYEIYITKCKLYENSYDMVITIKETL